MWIRWIQIQIRNTALREQYYVLPRARNHHYKDKMFTHDERKLFIPSDSYSFQLCGQTMWLNGIKSWNRKGFVNSKLITWFL
jgi:hypothetical protein